MIFPIRETWRAKGLFGDWPETILWSCLQGVMGGVYGDDPLRPRSAAAILGDFCFLAGEVNRELVGFRPGGFHIMIPQNERWSMAIEERYGGRVKRITRYAVKKEKDVFDGDRLRTFCDGSSETPIWSNSSLVRRSRSLISTKMPGVVFSPRKTFSAALMPGIKVNS